MTEMLTADASPEKRLFISLLTRDISMVAAFLDLVDNSINAAVAPMSSELETAKNYQKVLVNDDVQPTVDIRLKLTTEEIQINDTAPGISATTAAEHVFKFGRASGEPHENDRLSVYGIGLKRAMFKLGNKIRIISDHIEGGFELQLNVREWASDVCQPWGLEISPRAPVDARRCGTSITIGELYDDTVRRLDDGVFEGQLIGAISRTYAFYLAKFVKILVNDKQVEGINIQLGSNYTSEVLTIGDVTCSITAGIAVPEGGSFRDRSSGWFVFCNGRAVISADKTPLTGWSGSGLPIFQPKHRPFLGTVFFVARNAEELPWTTTKAGINEDSLLWQETKRQMISVGRGVVSYLDRRYTDEGTEVASKDLREVAGNKISALAAAASKKKKFEPPKRKPPKNIRIQYDAAVGDVERIKEYLQKPGMGGAEVGRYTFRYFLRNEVGDD